MSPSDASVSREDFKKLTEYLGSGGGNCTPRFSGYEPDEIPSSLPRNSLVMKLHVTIGT